MRRTRRSHLAIQQRQIARQFEELLIEPQLAGRRRGGDRVHARQYARVGAVQALREGERGHPAGSSSSLAASSRATDSTKPGAKNTHSVDTGSRASIFIEYGSPWWSTRNESRSTTSSRPPVFHATVPRVDALDGERPGVIGHRMAACAGAQNGVMDAEGRRGPVERERHGFECTAEPPAMLASAE